MGSKNGLVGLGVFLVFTFCLLAPVSWAMGSAPPPPTQEVEIIPTASEEALAKEQIENLKNISINSKTAEEGHYKFLRDMYAGKRYLYDFNKTAQREIVRAVKDKRENWKYRYGAINFLNPDGSPDAFDALVSIYKDKTERIELRKAAIGSLASSMRKTRQTDAVNVFIEALNDEDDYIAAVAANGLGRIKDNRAVEPLIEAVKKSRGMYKKLLQRGWKEYEKGSTDIGLRLLTAMRALGEIKAKNAVPLLIEIMEDMDFDHKVDADSINSFATMALGEIGDVRALPAINKALEEKKYKSHLDIYEALSIAKERIENESK